MQIKMWILITIKITYLTVAFNAPKALNTAGVEIEGIVEGSTSQKKVSLGAWRV